MTVGLADAETLNPDRQTVDRIIENVKALKADFPQLAQIDEKGKISENQDPERFGVGFEYQQGLHYVPNPNFDPQLNCGRVGWEPACEKKGAKTVKQFDANGIFLGLHFYKGEWMGQAEVRSFEIGDLKVVVFLEGEPGASLDNLDQRIHRILEQEKAPLSKLEKK